MLPLVELLWTTCKRFRDIKHQRQKKNPSHQLSFMLLIVFSKRVSCVFPVSRYKGRRPECHAPHVPNQPSEAAAHFYFELAKTVLIKAGGNSSTSIFTQPSASGGHQGPHRNLHLCAFEIGLYALGLHNFVSPNWLSRTYSSHVSWITGEEECACVCACVCVYMRERET